MLNSFCVKCSNKKKGTRSATTNFGKEEVLKVFAQDLHIIQEGGRGLGKDLIYYIMVLIFLKNLPAPYVPAPSLLLGAETELFVPGTL